MLANLQNRQINTDSIYFQKNSAPPLLSCDKEVGKARYDQVIWLVTDGKRSMRLLKKRQKEEKELEAKLTTSHLVSEKKNVNEGNYAKSRTVSTKNNQRMVIFILRQTVSKSFSLHIDYM